VTKTSPRRLAAVVGGLVLLAAAGVAGFYFWQVNQFRGGPRTTAPDVLVLEYTGPGSLRRAETPPTQP
jgi:hypothetical protein